MLSLARLPAGPPARCSLADIKDLILATMREDEDSSLYTPKAVAKLLATSTDTLARMVSSPEERAPSVHAQSASGCRACCCCCSELHQHS